MKILFTGGSSHTGQRFIKELAQKGHDVTAIYTSAQNDYNGLKGERVSMAKEYCTQVFNTKFGDEKFLELIKSSNWDLFCHHATESGNARSDEFDYVKALGNNTNNLEQVLKTLKEQGCNHILYTGTIYEPDEGAGTSPLDAFSTYGLSKAITFDAIKYFAHKHSFNIGKFVIPLVYGPFEERKMTTYLVKKWLSGEVPTVLGPKYVRDNIEVGLLAKAYGNFAEEFLKNNVDMKTNPSDLIMSLKDFSLMFAEKMEKRLRVPCLINFFDQKTFEEPRVRINIDSLEKFKKSWKEEKAWDELAEFYLKYYGPAKKNTVKNKKGEEFTVGVAIVTYKDKKHIANCLTPLVNSPIKPRIVVFNSTSNDGTVEEAQKFGVETLIIPRTQMNHGYAREVSRKFLGTDIVVMMTPDAYAFDENMLEKLIEPIIEGKASISCARQIPHQDANEIAAFSRAFNYPEKSNIRSKEDADKYGVYTAFCSDSCTAWSNKALDEIGGFRWVLSGEDAVAASMLLKKGHKIAYAAKAMVRHSHNYGPKKEFIRHFDTGMYRRQWKETLDFGQGNEEKRGVIYAIELVKHLSKKNPKLIPRAIAQLGMGWMGFKLGWITLHRMPESFYKKLSPADFFWNSDDYKKGRWLEPAE